LKHSVDIAELVRMYEVERLTTRQIAALTGISSRTVCRYLASAGAHLRNPGSPVNTTLGSKEWLVKRYVEDGKSTPEIAQEIGCSPRTVAHWLHRHSIAARPTGSTQGHKRNDSETTRKKMREAKRDRFIGSDNPNWKGGKLWKDPERSRYRNKAWVQAVKDRDGWCCIKCGSTDRLHAHHIKPWRHYPESRYDVSNGQTLCYECHEKAHGRGWEFRWRKVRPKTTSASAP
jgi:transposase